MNKYDQQINVIDIHGIWYLKPGRWIIFKYIGNTYQSRSYVDPLCEF